MNLEARVLQLQSQLQGQDQLTAVNAQLTQQLEQFRTENSRNSTRVTQLETENQNLKEQLKIQVQKIGNFESRVSQLQTQMQTLQNTLQYKDTQIAQLELQLKGYNDLQNVVVQKPNSQFIEMMVRKAFQNQNQKEGDKARLHNTDFIFKAFDSEQNLLKTLPRKLFKTLDLWIEKHEFFPASFLPSQYNLNKYSLVMDNAVFHGPFSNGVYLQVEQQQSDKPKFYFKWRPNDHSYLAVAFCDSTSEKCLYFIGITNSRVYLGDYTTNERLHEYTINGDGSLGEKPYTGILKSFFEKIFNPSIF